MSWIMHAFKIDEHGKYKSVGESLFAGFYNYPEKFWGAPIMSELGLKILPTLKINHFISAMGDELDELENEAQTILDNSDLIAETLSRDAIGVCKYANNLLQCIESAREVNGGVQFSG